MTGVSQATIERMMLFEAYQRAKKTRKNAERFVARAKKSDDPVRLGEARKRRRAAAAALEAAKKALADHDVLNRKLRGG